MIYNILNYSNIKTGLIGTNGIYYDNIKIESDLTTPDTVDLFYIISNMLKENVRYIVMEVSAHAIYLNKLNGIKFEIGALTNISQDHLDFFKTLSNYALVKQKFLTKHYCKNIFFNIDDEYGKLFYKLSNFNKIGFGLNNPADCFAMDICLNSGSSKFIINAFDSVMEVNNHFIGLFNVYNALCAISICKFLQVDSDNIVNSFLNMKEIDGRMNCYKLFNGAIAIIDFAHTPDGLEKGLKALQNLKCKDSRLICVFGCGGNRDNDKRSKMGRIASENADYVFLTSDNPRNEEPFNIIKDIMKGITKKNVIIDEDRRNAIIKAINFSKKDDIIFISGKGNEKYQEINGKKIPFSDKDIIDTYTKG